MQLKVTSVTKILLTDLDERLDPISIVLEDIEPRKGKIIIECFGESWSSYWGGMGDRTISEFVRSCDNEYLIDKLAPHLNSVVGDFDNLESWFKSNVIKLRREGDLDKGDASELWGDISLWCVNDEPFLHSEKGSLIAYKIFGDRWWELLPEKANHKYVYLDKIVTTVKQGLEEYASLNHGHFS